MKVTNLNFFRSLFMVLGLWLQFASSAAVEEKHVLYLNSYHIGYEWAENITEGITDVLGDHDEIKLYIEFLDTKRRSGEDYYRLLYHLYQEKYNDVNFDMIMVSDNNALDFLLEFYQRDLFRELPVVYCGIGNPEDYTFPPQFYGVKENSTFAYDVSAILEMFPETEMIYVVMDKSQTNQLYRKEFEFLDELIGSACGIGYLDEYDPYAIDLMLDTLNEASALIYMSVNTDKHGNRVNPLHVLRDILLKAKMPVFSNPYGEGKEGIIGGAVVNGIEHGKMSAELALDVLHGRTDHLPTEDNLVEPAKRYRFDYEVSKQFGITQSDLPEGAQFYNKPAPVYQKFRSHILIVGFTFLGLIIVIFVLVWNIIKRRKAEAVVAEQLKEIGYKNREINKHNEQLSGVNAKLGKLNKELTLANIQLSEAKIKAEHANRLKSSFLFNISHEIRTPLNSIVGFSDILSDDDVEAEERKKYSSIIASNANRLLVNVEHLLEYARLETLQEELVNDTFSFLPVLKNLVEEKRDELENVGNSLLMNNELEPGGDAVYMDAYKFSRLAEIVIQTYNRICKGEVLHLRCFKADGGQFCLRFDAEKAYICDQGIEQIFEPFVQTEHHELKKLEGIGLALAIAKAYAEMMRGRMSAERTGKEGLSFMIVLPFSFDRANPL